MDKKNRILITLPPDGAQAIAGLAGARLWDEAQTIRVLAAAGWSVMFPGVPCPIPRGTSLVSGLTETQAAEALRAVRGAA